MRSIPDDVLKQAEQILDDFCQKEIPLEVQDKLRLGHLTKGMTITLLSFRPMWNNPSEWRGAGVARFRYTKKTGLWSLYQIMSNGKWTRYPQLEPQEDFQVLMNEVDADPTCIFWG